MNYSRFAMMILTSTLVMFALMYLNTYALEHIFFSETRAYMAILMGATMAFVMMAFMMSMYPSRVVNISIFIGSVLVFGLSLWLVRSQTTVNGESYMRAMIPHHSIAIMTSERAGIEDARVTKLADSISAAQKKEISEMRALIADLDEGGIMRDVYEDPAPQAGTIDDALNNTLLAGLDLAPLQSDLAEQFAPSGDTCVFRRTRTEAPILIAAADGSTATALLNGVVLSLSGEDNSFETNGLRISVSEVGGERSDSLLTFDLNPGPQASYRGFWSC